MVWSQAGVFDFALSSKNHGNVSVVCLHVSTMLVKHPNKCVTLSTRETKQVLCFVLPVNLGCVLGRKLVSFFILAQLLQPCLYSVYTTPQTQLWRVCIDNHHAKFDIISTCTHTYVLCLLH